MLPHILFHPRSYEADEQRRWPLMLFLHGAGERGSDLRKLRKYGPPRIVQRDPDFPFILIAPQCPAGSYWRSRPLIELLDAVIASNRVDESRICATGVSMGGYGVWQLAMDQPDRFAAIAPICGGGDPRTVARIKHVPVWAFHGEADDIVPLSESVEMVAALRAAGGNVKFTIFPSVGHDSWTPAYAMPELYEWLLAQRTPI